MADFDANAALAAGHSQEDIDRIQRGIAAARAAGYSDEEIKAHLSGASGPAPPPPGGSASGWGHLPLMLGQTAANAVIGAVNAPGEISGLINKYTAPLLPKALTTPLPDLLRGNITGADTGEGGTLPYVDLGPGAAPQGPVEPYVAGALGGALTAGSIGAASRIPAILSGGKELLAEVPRLLKESGILGAIPGLASVGAEQNFGLDKLDPGIRTAVEASVGAAAAIAAHRFLGGNPIEGVAKTLGDSENSDEAGRVAQAKIRDWRGTLNAKLDTLKGSAYGPTGEDVQGATMFGKVPLDDAKVDNTQTMAMLRSLSNQGGVYKDVFHSFVSDMPPRMRGLFESIAMRNNPIMEFPPKATEGGGSVSAGPVEENPPQMTGGTAPPYGGPPGPLRNDSFQALTVPPKPGEVGFHLPEPSAAPNFVRPQGTVTGFAAPLRDAMELRSAVGEWLSNPKLMPRDTTEAQASALYKALSGDIGNTMDHYGAKPEWDSYNSSASALYHAGSLLSKIAGDVNPSRDDVAGGKAIESLWSGMRKDSSEITNLRTQVPEAADEVSAAFLRSHPDKWNKMPSETQKALVPNPFDRLALNSASPEKSGLLAEAQKSRQLLEIPSAGSVGYVLGELGQSYAHDISLGATSPPLALTAAAMALPTAARFLGKVYQNPRLLNIPATGAISATSPLLGKATKAPEGQR